MYLLMLHVSGPLYLVGTHRSATLARATWARSVALYMAVSCILSIEGGEKHFAFLGFAVITSSRDTATIAGSLIAAFLGIK